MLTELERGAVHTMRTSLDTWVACASAHEKHLALSWYDVAYVHAKTLAHTYGVTLSQSSAVISILSPGTPWEQNILDAERVCKAWILGTYDAVVGTYYSQLSKAYIVLDEAGDKTEEELFPYIGLATALKTRAFYCNILHPDLDTYVTIDRWIMRALGIEVQRISPRLYALGAEAIRAVARYYGVLPQQAQAIVWVSIRARQGMPQYALPF